MSTTPPQVSQESATTDQTDTNLTLSRSTPMQNTETVEPAFSPINLDPRAARLPANYGAPLGTNKGGV
jgi:hypothetical protein